MVEITESVDHLGINEDEEDIVTPWNVASASQKGVDYDKLISKCKYLP